MSSAVTTRLRWSQKEISNIFHQPFNDLIMTAHQVLRENFPKNEIQLSRLHNIKTGSCPENCRYCSQSAHYQTDLTKKKLSSLASVLQAAKKAKEGGATRFCMGAAWRSPRNDDLEQVKEMIAEVKKMGLETCVTLGMLKEQQAQELKKAGLDYYNHNIDTSPEFYDKIVTTRSFHDRIETINYVDKAGIKVCCGLIIGMEESESDRISALRTLANLNQPPKSVPINMLIPMSGTPLQDAKPLHPFDFIRVIATARIIMPNSYVRLSAGREKMTDEMHALCFFAGANSIFIGEDLLTAKNSLPQRDEFIMKSLNISSSS